MHYLTVVEVVRQLPQEWMHRNLQVGALDTVWSGLGARPFPRRDRGRKIVMGAFERAHPKTAVTLYSMMAASYEGTDEVLVEMMAKISMVAIRPKT